MSLSLCPSHPEYYRSACKFSLIGRLLAGSLSRSHTTAQSPGGVLEWMRLGISVAHRIFWHISEKRSHLCTVCTLHKMHTAHTMAIATPACTYPMCVPVCLCARLSHKIKNKMKICARAARTYFTTLFERENDYYDYCYCYYSRNIHRNMCVCASASRS